jgi:hypothetical protein
MLETVKREAGKTVPHGNIFGEIYDVTTTDLRFFLGKTSSVDGVTMTKTSHSNASLRRAAAVTQRFGQRRSGCACSAGIAAREVFDDQKRSATG